MHDNGPIGSDIAKLEATLDSITDGVLMLDRDWRYTYVSERAGKTIGMPPESLVGGRVWDLFPHARGTKFYEGYHRAMETMQPVTFEEYYPEPLNLWIECHCFPAAESLTVYFRDVTKWRRSEEALQQSTAMIRAISDASADVIFAKDRDGRMLFVNPATLKLIGKPAEQVLGYTDAEFLGNAEAAREVMANDRRIMDAAASMDIEELVPTPDGTPRIWLSRKTVMRDEAGAVMGLLGISRDITERKHAEDELRAAEARQAFLVRLGDTLHRLADPAQVQAAAARLLREHLDASRVHYAEVEPDAERVNVWSDHAMAVPDRAGRYALADFPRLAEEMRAGRTLIINDVTAEPRLEPHEKATYLALPVAALVVVPIQKLGRLTAVLSVHRSTPHAWSAEEVRLIAETALRTWEAVLRAKAEEALRASEERYRRAMETMIEGCAIFSPDWTYLFVNKVNAEQAHSTPEDMVGRTMFEVLPGIEKSPFFAAYRRCMEERTPQRVASEFTYEDGSTAWFEAVAEPVAEGILVRSQDVTIRKRDERALRESEELVRTIAENSTQALVMMDERGYCIYWNPALLAMTGYTADELRSGPLHDLIHHHRPDGRPYPMAECPIDRALPENFDVRAHEDVFFRKDGTQFPVLCAASPIKKDGRSVATVVEVRDITERKQAEEALRDADRRKDEFIAILAHELRNPLAPVRTAIEILRRSGPADPRLIRARDVIDRQITHMARLIDDLLDVSRVARGKLALQLERCDVAQLARLTAEDYRGNLEAAGLSLDVETPVTPLWIEADPVRVVQMLGNLLNNAGRFTERGGRIHVYVARSGPWAEVTVADSGIGIEPTLLSRLFDPFSQAAQDLARTKGGLGLGLVLTKGLVELHAGEVIGESPGAGRGSTFRLRFPASAEPVQPSIETALPARSTLRILIVEDNQDAAEMLGDLLDLAGHTVKLAFDGATGLQAAREFRPQVVVSDLGLPGDLDGYGLARALRSDESLGNLYLIALSGYGSEDARRLSAAAGFDAHLAKPANLTKLEAMLAAFAAN